MNTDDPYCRIVHSTEIDTEREARIQALILKYAHVAGDIRTGVPNEVRCFACNQESPKSTHLVPQTVSDLQEEWAVRYTDDDKPEFLCPECYWNYGWD
jgi:hypothetical protein